MKVKRTERSNSFCGPAALSLITGKTVDDCVKEIHAYRNRDGFLSGFRRRQVRGMSNTEIRAVLRRMGFNWSPIGTLFGFGTNGCPWSPTLAGFMRWLKKHKPSAYSPKKVYLITVTGHYVVMKGIKLYDNKNPEGVFFGKYNHRRVRVKHVWEVGRMSRPVSSECPRQPVAS